MSEAAMEQLQEITRINIAESYKDFVGIWETVIDIEKAFPDRELTDDEVRDFSLQIIKSMLDDQNIRAGEFTKAGFIVWDSPQTEIIDRIAREWTELGVRSPDPFGIVSFGALPLIKRLKDEAANVPAKVEQRRPTPPRGGHRRRR